MQQSLQMIPMVLPTFPPTNITTEQIQKCLDENKKLIMAILENQNLGKLAECAQYQALLQKNLMYLAAIADAQPQPPPTPGAITPQAMAPHPSAMQPQSSYFMQQQHPQAVGMAQQISPAIFPPRGPIQFGSLHQLHDSQQVQLHQQAMQGHMEIRPMCLNNNNGLQHPMHHPETVLGANNAMAGPNDTRAVGKHDGTNVNQSGADGQVGSAARHRGGDTKK
ncbi:GRF1-interacting factor 3 [Cardamine amara subsp. amara]|uniref:GRF1-interacting factor 3 n=1 Tax=Cardamine amara subsp. amara TaxID=228776 RepID=A0ABD0ZTZ3_CARAN